MDRRRTVLIVDDSITCQFEEAQALREIPAIPVFARSGAAAVEMARREAPDLILMDVEMPGIDGVETTRQIRAMGVACPILMVTTLDNIGRQLEASRAGANDYVLKGKPEQLAKKAARFMWILGGSHA